MTTHLENIPLELRTPPLWLQYYETRDPKKPDKKAGKHPCVKYAAPEDRKANLRSLDKLLNRPRQAGFQRYVDPAEGFVYIDIDKVRNADTGAVELWAEELIEELDSYTEISASGKGFHIVCRGKLDEDFHRDPNPVEIYRGKSTKLIAITGDVYELHTTIQERQPQVEQLLKRIKGGSTQVAEPIDWRKRFHTVDELPDGDILFLINDVLPEGVAFIGALSGAGKTWFCLSMARALTTGKRFLGNHAALQGNRKKSLSKTLLGPWLAGNTRSKSFLRRAIPTGLQNGSPCILRHLPDGTPFALKKVRRSGAQRGASENNFGQRFSVSTPCFCLLDASRPPLLVHPRLRSCG